MLIFRANRFPGILVAVMIVPCISPRINKEVTIRKLSDLQSQLAFPLFHSPHRNAPTFKCVLLSFRPAAVNVLYCAIGHCVLVFCILGNAWPVFMTSVAFGLHQFLGIFFGETIRSRHGVTQPAHTVLVDRQQWCQCVMITSRQRDLW